MPRQAPKMAVRPVMSPLHGAEFSFGGLVGERIAANQEAWLLQTPHSNPAMLQMFRDRDRKPRRTLVPWAGEFPGKHLTSAVGGYRLTREPRLRQMIERLVMELASAQDRDGYLGPHPKSERLTGKTHDGKRALWDIWGHYHCILGLLSWWRETRDRKALATACRAADLLCDRFLDTGVHAISAGAEEMNLAVAHGLCLLYEATGVERYLRMAREIERDWETPPAGDYLRTALAGLPFFQTPKPRWESLHDIQAMTELFFITGDERYHQAVAHIWRSIRATDRHNTGGFSSAERAVGNPYDWRPIETCCVVAWAALSLDMLRLTGDSIAADEIELATFNAVLGAQHPSGRWWTYNTPMDGVRRASAHDIVFQAHEGAPELNCCSVNGPRALGMLSEWAFMRTSDGLAVNFYGPCFVELPLAPGVVLALSQEADYPRDGRVTLRLALTRPHTFTIHLRIPAWSRHTRVSVNGRVVRDVRPGSCLTLRRQWQSGDAIRLSFDMALRVWPGEREAAGCASLYRGPLLLAYDRRFNDFDPDELPPLDVQDLSYVVEKPEDSLAPWLLLAFKAAGGRAVRLCDFASAGMAGTHYRSWLPMRSLEALPAAAVSPFAVEMG